MGDSDSPDGPWTMADYASDALAVMDHLGIDEFSLLGISFGGMVAQELAVSNPARTDRLVLWSTSAGGSAGSSFALETLATLDEQERNDTLLKLIDSRFDEKWLEEHPRDRLLVGRGSSGRSTSPPDQIAARRQLEARSAHDVSSRLEVLRSTSVFVGVGNYDIVAPPRNAEAIARLTGATMFERYEGGHLFFFQDRRAFTDLETFLK